MDERSWLLANINQTGYFRVNYDLHNWKLLIQQLHSGHQVPPHSLPVASCLTSCFPFSSLMKPAYRFFQVISVGNRAGLIDDAFNLAR